MEKNVHIIEITIEKEEFDATIDKAYEKKKNKIKLDGFREGKVPKDVYFTKAGKESLYEEAVNILLPIAYKRLIEKNKLLPIIEPSVSIKKIDSDGVVLEFTITTEPEIEIKKYKNLGITKPEVIVSDEEINHEIEHILEKYSDIEEKDGLVENGDIAIIDYEGFKDGVPFEGGKDENHSLEIGSNSFIPGFEEALIGMKKGEEKDINLTFPEDYHEESLKGKEVIFKVKVNEIKHKVSRVMDKDFFEDLAMEGVSNEEELKNKVKEKLIKQKETQAEDKYVSMILEEIRNNTTVTLNESIIQSEIDFMLKNIEKQMRSNGISLEVFFSMTGSNMEKAKAELEPEARKNIMNRLILNKIIELENISITEEEINNKILEIKNMYNLEGEDLEKLNSQKEDFAFELKITKALDIIKG